MERGKARRHREARSAESILLHGGTTSVPVIGRVIGKELTDELGDRVSIIVDGIDGRVHHVALGEVLAEYVSG